MVVGFESGVADSRTCMQIVMQYGPPINAWGYCRGLGARVCSFNDFMQMCASYSVYGNYTTGWYQDHAVAIANYKQWSGTVCDTIYTNIYGGIAQTTSDYYRCCK